MKYFNILSKEYNCIAISLLHITLVIAYIKSIFYLINFDKAPTLILNWSFLYFLVFTTYIIYTLLFFLEKRAE